MKLSICTDVYNNLSFPDMLDKVQSLGVHAVEMTAGGWASCPRVPGGARPAKWRSAAPARSSRAKWSASDKPG